MPLPHCYNFAGTDIAEKFRWVDGAPGLAAVVPAADGLRGVGGSLTDATEGANSRMRELGTTWTGPAAEAAQNSLAETADGASETARITTNGADRLLDYGNSFERVRNQIAFVDPAQFSWVQQRGDDLSEFWQRSLGTLGEDHVTIGERNQANDAAANRALQAHESLTNEADNRFVTAAAAAPGSGDPGGAPAPGGPGVGGGSPLPPPTHVTTPSEVRGPIGGGPGAPPLPTPGGPGGPPAAQPPKVGGGAPLPPVGGGGGGTAGGNGRAGGPNGGANRSAPGAPPTGSANVPQGPGQRPGESLGRPTPGTPNAPGVGPGVGAGPWKDGGAADSAARRSDLGRSFGRDLAGARFAGPAPGSPSTGGYRGRGGPGSSGPGPDGGPGAGRTGAGTWGSGPGSGGSGAGEAGGRGPASERGLPRGGIGESAAGRGALGESAGARSGGAGSGYGPVMGGGAGTGQGGQEHRNRYLIPTDEAFDVDLHYTSPVLGPLTDDDGD